MVIARGIGTSPGVMRAAADPVNRRINEFFSPQNSPFVCRIEFLTMAVLDSSGYKLSVSLAGDTLLYAEMTQHRVDIHHARRLHTQISAMATVFVVLGLVHYPGSHRIEMDIPHQLA